MLTHFENYFGIPFPLSKFGKPSYYRKTLIIILVEFRSKFIIIFPLDLIAVPDFIAGAMENWGAAVFREGMMLYDAELSPASSKQLIAIVVAHEVAHQVQLLVFPSGLWLGRQSLRTKIPARKT